MNTPSSAKNHPQSIPSEASIIQSLVLPQEFESKQYNDRIQLGNSLTSSAFLYIEELSQKLTGVPTIMADSELDLFICSSGKVNYLHEMGQEVLVAGNLGEDSISGYLIWVNCGEGKGFLIFSGNKNPDNLDKSQSLALELAQQLTNAPSMKAAA